MPLLCRRMVGDSRVPFRRSSVAKPLPLFLCSVLLKQHLFFVSASPFDLSDAQAAVLCANLCLGCLWFSRERATPSRPVLANQVFPLFCDSALFCRAEAGSFRPSIVLLRPPRQKIQSPHAACSSARPPREAPCSSCSVLSRSRQPRLSSANGGLFRRCLAMVMNDSGHRVSRASIMSNSTTASASVGGNAAPSADDSGEHLSLVAGASPCPSSSPPAPLQLPSKGQTCSEKPPFQPVKLLV